MTTIYTIQGTNFNEVESVEVCHCSTKEIAESIKISIEEYFNFKINNLPKYHQLRMRREKFEDEYCKTFPKPKSPSKFTKYPQHILNRFLKLRDQNKDQGKIEQANFYQQEYDRMLLENSSSKKEWEEGKKKFNIDIAIFTKNVKTEFEKTLTEEEKLIWNFDYFKFNFELPLEIIPCKLDDFDINELNKMLGKEF